jgi:anti-anti-sigma factor
MQVYTLKIIDYNDLSEQRNQTRLEKDIQRLIDGAAPDSVLVDLNKISFILSFAITQIVKLYRYCKKNKISFRVKNAGKTYEMFKSLRLTNMFEVEP